MTQERASPLSEEDKAFNSLLKDVKDLLSRIRKDVTNGEGILDPNTQKKRELFVRLRPIVMQLERQWEALHKEEEKARISGSLKDKDLIPKIQQAKHCIYSAMIDLREIIDALASLNRKKENDLKNQINRFNEETSELYGYNQEIASILVEYDLLKLNTIHVARLEYGRDISDYLSYVIAALKGAVTIGLAWSYNLSEAAKAAGSIFYPVSAAFTTLAKLFSLLGRISQFFIARSESERAKAVEEDRYARNLRLLELQNTESLLGKSVIFKFLTFSFNLLSTLAFAGVLATPLGWCFVAAATFVDWIDDGLGGVQRADKQIEKFKEQHNMQSLSLVEKTELAELQTKANTARSEATWGLINTIAMALIGFGPFVPFAGPFLGLAGLALFGVVAIRNTYVVAKPYAENYFAVKNTTQEELTATASHEKTHEFDIELQATGPMPAQHERQKKEPRSPDIIQKQQFREILATPPTLTGSQSTSLREGHDIRTATASTPLLAKSAGRLFKHETNDQFYKATEEKHSSSSKSTATVTKRK